MQHAYLTGWAATTPKEEYDTLMKAFGLDEDEDAAPAPTRDATLSGGGFSYRTIGGSSGTAAGR